MSDYSGYNTDQFMWDLYGSPQFGQDEAGLPGDSVSKRMSMLKSIMSTTGIPIVQLLGLDPATMGGQEQQDPLPVNQTGAMYGSNPMYASAFAAIDEGKDPESVYQTLVSKAQDYGFDPNDPTATDRIFSTVLNYAKDKVGVQEAAAKQSAGSGSTFTLPSGKKIHGGPDIMGFQSEFDLLGQPQVADLMSQYAASMRPKNMKHTVSRKGGVDVAPGFEQVGSTVFGPNGFKQKVGSSQEGYDLAQNSAVAGLSKNQRFQAERVFNKRINSSKQNMVRSDANANAMRAVLALRNLVGF